MKKMKFSLKLIFTIILVITFFYAVVAYFTTLNYDFVNNTTHFTLMGINFLIILFLIVRVSMFSNIDFSKKILWSVLFFVFSPSILIYLWKVDDEFIIESQIE